LKFCCALIVGTASLVALVVALIDVVLGKTLQPTIINAESINIILIAIR